MWVRNMKQVIVNVTTLGEVTIEAQGFKGQGCAKATEQLEIVLGGAGEVTKKKKPEFFAPSPSTAVNNKLTF